MGCSYGANVGLAVARPLQVAGARVALLLDPALPTTRFEVHQPGPAVDRAIALMPPPELLNRFRILRRVRGAMPLRNRADST